MLLVSLVVCVMFLSATSWKVGLASLLVSHATMRMQHAMMLLCLLGVVLLNFMVLCHVCYMYVMCYCCYLCSLCVLGVLQKADKARLQGPAPQATRDRGTSTGPDSEMAPPKEVYIYIYI